MNSKKCNYESCNADAFYGLYFGVPDRCREHKEKRKGQLKSAKKINA